MPKFNAGRIVYGGTSTKITEAEVAAYKATFPDAQYQAGARKSPILVPDTPDNPASEANRDAWAVLRRLQLPVLTLFGADDRVMERIERVFQKQTPGATGQKHKVLPNAGHFLQEDVGPDLAQANLAFMNEMS